MAVLPQNRKGTLAVAAFVAVGFGVYFLRNFFTVIAFAAITAYLLNPLYSWLSRKLKRKSSAASLTLLACVAIIIIPLVLVGFLTFFQVQNIVHSVQNGTLDITTVGKFGQKLLDDTNRLLAHFPGDHHITQAMITSHAESAVGTIAQKVLSFLSGSAGNVASLFVTVILYIYLFMNMLIFQGTLLGALRRLNPLGIKASNEYLTKMGKMTTAMVRGQFIVAIVQGLVGAIILAFVGFQYLFFFMFMLLSLLSIIPLGGGIVAIPIGVVLLLTGHIWQGLLVLLGHFLIVTNIDNLIRPRLVPRSAHLNSALTLLSVFAGVGMFGFLGIVVGPVLMILIVSTIQMYLAAQEEKQPLAKEG
ncbi:MAG TPA: AI-2E family transporter [Patescibacteria group bacterium]|nr:AI-2E family transporter [Patescibacteria group bacterium]